MVLDEVASEMLRRKLDDARFLAMWVANETSLFLAKLGDEGANAERLAAFVRMVRGTWRRRWRFARSAKLRFVR